MKDPNWYFPYYVRRYQCYMFKKKRGVRKKS